MGVAAAKTLSVMAPGGRQVLSAPTHALPLRTGIQHLPASPRDSGHHSPGHVPGPQPMSDQAQASASPSLNHVSLGRRRGRAERRRSPGTTALTGWVTCDITSMTSAPSSSLQTAALSRWQVEPGASLGVKRTSLPGRRLCAQPLLLQAGPPGPGTPFPTMTSDKTSTAFPGLACPEPGSVSPEGLSPRCDWRELQSGLTQALCTHAHVPQEHHGQQQGVCPTSSPVPPLWGRRASERLWTPGGTGPARLCQGHTRDRALAGDTVLLEAGD